MQVSLCNIGLYRMTIRRETEPQQYVEKNKFLNQLDESFGFMCTHISRDILFHLEGLRTPKEAGDKIESLFGKQDDLQGNILENELMLSDKYTQSESSHISLVQVDLEKIKYRIQPTFLDQMEMQSSGQITYLKICKSSSLFVDPSSTIFRSSTAKPCQASGNKQTAYVYPNI